jgi:hypothetical protein
MESPHERALRDIEEVFGDRLEAFFREGSAATGRYSACRLRTATSGSSVSGVVLLLRMLRLDHVQRLKLSPVT